MSGEQLKMQLENFLSKRRNLMWKGMSNVPMSSNQMLQTSLKFTNEFSFLEFYLFIKCIVVVSISCTKTIPMTCVRLKMACTKLCWIKNCCMVSLFVIFQLLILNFQIGDVNYVKGIKKNYVPFFCCLHYVFMHLGEKMTQVLPIGYYLLV